MKKLKLSLQTLKGAEVLSREQLKKIMGGFEGSGNCGQGYIGYNCSINVGSSWSSPSIACIPVANGGTAQDAADYLMSQYQTKTTLCDEGCAVSCG